MCKEHYEENKRDKQEWVCGTPIDFSRLVCGCWNCGEPIHTDDEYGEMNGELWCAKCYDEAVENES